MVVEAGVIFLGWLLFLPPWEEVFLKVLLSLQSEGWEEVSYHMPLLWVLRTFAQVRELDIHLCFSW
jgi:hypothetical protein